jgi:hypothetical protein
MNNIFYLDDNPFFHWDSKRKINSFIWKILYKRVQKKINKDLINIETIRKIIFNKNHFVEGNIKAPLPYVMLRNEPVWYLDDDSIDYFIPLSISFSSAKTRFDIVLVDGEIEIRNVRNSKNHTPMFFIKNLKIIELCFKILLEYIEESNQEINEKDKK